MGDFRTPTTDPDWWGPLPRLTHRERPVLELVAAGWSTRRIAESLRVSDQCVTYHIGNLLAKFQSPNRAGLVSRAFVLGYLSPEWPPRADHSPQALSTS
jgi:DNA-binding NarL/FixJ family response regulator